ncbi:MAG: ABC-type transport auxiliary lipoprotein family protein [Candidatus Dormibacteria bacterium]
MNPKVKLLRALLPAGALAAGGCSGLLHSDAVPEQTYVLRAPAVAAAAAAVAVPAAQPASLRVAHPITAPGLDVAHIMLVQADHRMNFYTGSRWPAPLSDVVEALAVQTLRAARDWQSVQDSASPFPSEYLLQIAVRRFEADYTSGGAPQVHVILDCTFGRRAGEVVASFVAQASADAGGNRMSEVVAAFEQASDAALTSLAQQTAAAVRATADHGASPH